MFRIRASQSTREISNSSDKAVAAMDLERHCLRPTRRCGRQGASPCPPRGSQRLPGILLARRMVDELARRHDLGGPSAQACQQPAEKATMGLPNWTRSIA
jgi:hypothetical protein